MQNIGEIFKKRRREERVLKHEKTHRDIEGALHYGNAPDDWI